MNTKTLYQQAELAQAAYALNLVFDASNIDALTDARTCGMSQKQAEIFAETHTVLDQYTDSATGVSATIFRNNQTGELCVAVRGTELQTGDLLADGILALGSPSYLNPQFMVLKTQMDVWLSDSGPLNAQAFTVTGHSLGGYLAAAYLYNAPGELDLYDPQASEFCKPLISNNRRQRRWQKAAPGRGAFLADDRE